MQFPKLREAGRRHSGKDQQMLQTMHDHAVSLGATCGTMESAADPIIHDGAANVFAEAGMSYNDILNILRAALRMQYPGTNVYVWPRDVYPDAVVYEVSDMGGAESLYKRSYSIVDGKVTLGDPTKVIAVTDYVPVSEAQESSSSEITTDLVPLVEKAVKADGTAKIKIIQAGMGSSGYYPAEVLQRDGPNVFTEGTHIYFDHPSASEAADRPERSVKDLAGSLTGPAVWEEHGAAGPGLYAPVKFIDSVAPHINSIAAISGMSIRAAGTVGTREVDGKRVRSIESLDAADSIDVVTKAGAGGKVLELIESARKRADAPKGVEPVSQELEKLRADLDAANTALKEAKDREDAMNTRIARLTEANIMRDASAIVTESLASYGLANMTRERLTRELTLNPPLKDGALDKEALAAAVKEAAQQAVDEAAQYIGHHGMVRGMGSGGGADDSDARAELAKLFEANGHSPEIAGRMAAR